MSYEAAQVSVIPATRNGLAPAQGLVFDGSTAISTTTSSLGTLFTVSLNVTLSSVTPQIPLLFFSGAGFLGTRATTGALFFSTAASDFTSSVSAGVPTQVVIVGNGTTATPYINGVAGTAIAYTASVGGLTDISYAGNPSIIIQGLRLYNRALSAAEVLALYQSGAPAAADYDYTNQLTTAWTAGGTWSSFVSSSSTNISGTLSDGNSSVHVASTSFVRGNWGVSLLWRLRFDATITGGSGIIVYQYNGTSYLPIGSQAATGSFDVSFTGPANAYAGGNAVYIQNATGTATTIALTNIKLERLGLLLAPDSAQAGGGLAWYDTSGNAANITLPATGVSWNVPTSGKAFSLSLAGQLIAKGTATNDNAAAGYIGEYVSSTLGSASAISLTTNVSADVTSISLTAGDWDVTGFVGYNQDAATTINLLNGAASASSASFGTTPVGYAYGGTTLSTAGSIQLPLMVRRFSLSATTTIYLVTRANFGVGACTGFGEISARRVR